MRERDKFDEMLDYDRAVLRDMCRDYESALIEIANEDYRGNRPQSATIAKEVLDRWTWDA